MPASKHSDDSLSAYRAKRSADASPEPFGGGPGSGAGLFVVHKHAASRLHWDLRLEMGGVLESWAVPKGPSPNPADKRLAVKVEAHPLEYCEFEEVIPEGNYGAGAMIIWDRGRWVPLEDPEEGLEKGKLLFELRGYKLRGRWTLVKMKRTEKEWLFIKERDAFATSEEDGESVFPQDSILSGLTVEQLGAGTRPATVILRKLGRLKASQSRVVARGLKVMLAEPREEAFSDPGWLFEIKYDGYRLVVSTENGAARLTSRAGNDLTPTFPEVAKAVEALPFEHLVLDGEVVVHDESGLPSFGRLQKRGRLTRPLDIKRASIELPATLYLFDILGFDDYDLRTLPLRERKHVLKELLPSVGPLRFSDHIEEQGEAMFEQVQQMRLEGIVAKKVDSPYREGRSPQWLKIRTQRSDDFVIVGYTVPKGSRSGFGALHVAQYHGDELVYAGRVGTGFDSQQLEQIAEELASLLVDDPTCSGEVPKGAANRWVEPKLVCEVRFKEYTEADLLRHPVFVRMRDDKHPQECQPTDVSASLAEPQIVETELSTADRQVPYTNLAKVFWPEEGYTKGDLIEYYRSISAWLLPYLRDRPVVLTRYPDGITGKSFFQKDAPGFVPEWVRRERVWSEGSQRELEYFVCDDEESLLYIINLGTIPLHIWSSRVTSLEKPDWCVLDLDPKEAPFADVVKVARLIKRLCDEIALPSFIKSSGSSGLHVLLPLARQCTYEQSRMLGQLIGQFVVMELPDVATVRRQVSRRDGRVYVDYVQNGHGRLIASPFCVRPLPGAPVSASLKWTEVTAKLDIQKHNIRTVPKRMGKLAEDPLVGALGDAPDLVEVLGSLERLMA